MSNTLEDYKAIAAELKELNKKKKAIKECAKKEGIKLIAKRKEKDRCKEYNDLHIYFQEQIPKLNLKPIFENTITLEKPQGQKWVVFTLEGDYSFAILNNKIKAKKND